MKTFIILLSLTLTISLGLSSCYVSRVDVGSNGNNFTAKDKATVIYSKTKNVYLFWGLLPISTQQPPLPIDCNYTIETSTDFFDGLLYVITDGIFGMRTIKIKVKPPTAIPK
jgi:hypothetical protein